MLARDHHNNEYNLVILPLITTYASDYDQLFVEIKVVNNVLFGGAINGHFYTPLATFNRHFGDDVKNLLKHKKTFWLGDNQLPTTTFGGVQVKLNPYIPFRLDYTIDNVRKFKAWNNLFTEKTEEVDVLLYDEQLVADFIKTVEQFREL